MLIDWNLGDDDMDHERARGFIDFLRSRNDKIPIFLMAERRQGSAVSVEVLEQVDEFVWTLEDTASFVGGRVVAAIRRYVDVMLSGSAFTIWNGFRRLNVA